MAKPSSVFILDDHPIVRQGLTHLINQEKDFQVCGEAGNFHTALEAMDKLKPDIAIIDISLQQENGLEFIKTAKLRNPKSLFLVHSMHDETLYAERALRAGAKGYLMKQESAEKVIAALRQVLDGKVYVSDFISSKLFQKVTAGKDVTSHSPSEVLSDREFEVFQLIGKGFGTTEIAKKLHRSAKTIETYRARIKEKIGLKNSSELIRFAIQWVQSHFKE